MRKQQRSKEIWCQIDREREYVGKYLTTYQSQKAEKKTKGVFEDQEELQCIWTQIQTISE